MALFLFSGINCHNRTLDKVDEPNKETCTWSALWLNKQAIDSAIYELSAEIPKTATAKKRRPGAKVIELVTPASGPNTFIKQNYNE